MGNIFKPNIEITLDFAGHSYRFLTLQTIPRSISDPFLTVYIDFREFLQPFGPIFSFDSALSLESFNWSTVSIR